MPAVHTPKIFPVPAVSMHQVRPKQMLDWFDSVKFASRQNSLTFHRGKALAEVSNPNFGVECERKTDCKRAAGVSTG